jgi:hypothetical protein
MLNYNYKSITGIKFRQKFWQILLNVKSAPHQTNKMATRVYFNKKKLLKNK